MIDFDFSLPISSGQLTFMVTLKGLAHVRRSNRFLATDRLPSQIPIQQMRPTLSWKQPSATLFLSRSVPVHGIRAVDLPRESSRYRNLPAFYATQTLSCRVPGKHVPKHARRSQRKSRLADLCRLRPRSGRHGTAENAVKSQIWIAVSIYVLVAILKKRLKLEPSLHQILQVLSVTLFEKMPILRAFQDIDSKEPRNAISNQLILFDL